MRLALSLHPDSVCAAVDRIDVDVTRPRPGALALGYVVTGRIGALYLPAPVQPARADELWRRSCFEAFVRPAPGEAYLELNFAPSRQWAAYRFSSYRDGMAAADIPPPVIDVRTGGQRFELDVSVELPNHALWRLGLSAVIEEASGARSYWALAHSPGEPDFHHAAAFAYDLPS